MKTKYSAPSVDKLGGVAKLVRAGGANDDIDGFFYEDVEKFASFGTDKVS